MKLRLTLNKAVLTVLLTCGMMQNSFAGPPKYAVIDLGNFGKFTSRAQGINQFGHVTGFSTTPDLSLLHAFLWSDGDLNNLIPGIIDSEGMDINDSDQVVGWAGFPDRAFLWDNGTLIDLGTLGGERSIANAINNQGQVVGISNFDPTNPAGWRPFLWQDGMMESLTPSCDTCQGSANGINNVGEIVGSATTPDFANHAAFWDVDGTIHDLGALTQSAFSSAKSINDSGEIVGDSDGHAVYWKSANAQTEQLDAGSRFGSAAKSINNNGLIVGEDGTGRLHGAIWDTKGNERNLNSLVAPLPKLWVEIAFDINDKNQIAARARSKKGGFKFFAVVLTPVNPVFELVEPVPGVAGALNTIVARGGNLEPGSVVSFYWGVHGGGTLLPNCDMLDAVLQIENARFAGSAVVDDNGVATLEGMVPSGAKGLNILMQAVTGPGSPTGCGQSQLVVVKFK